MSLNTAKISMLKTITGIDFLNIENNNVNNAKTANAAITTTYTILKSFDISFPVSDE